MTKQRLDKQQIEPIQAELFGGEGVLAQNNAKLPSGELSSTIIPKGFQNTSSGSRLHKTRLETYQTKLVKQAKHKQAIRAAGRGSKFEPFLD
ncbi:MAG: hypothetical protein CM15mV103_140 [uncultured marine virus]|nr:MAG: hypothetical protein CM15mV103_140 [uncultured marine virus]